MDIEPDRRDNGLWRRILGRRERGRFSWIWIALTIWLACTGVVAVLPLFTPDGPGRGGGLPQAPPGLDPNDFYNRVYLRTRIGEVIPQPVGDLAAAGQLAGFPLLSPGSLPFGFPPPSQVGFNSSHAYRVSVDLQAARELLRTAGLPAGGLPENDRWADILVTIQPVASLHSKSEEAWFTLLQGRRPVAQLPEGMDPAALEQLGVLGLRYLGLTESEAAALAGRLGWTWFLAYPPGQRTQASPAEIRGVTGMVLRKEGQENDAALIWEAGDVIYGLYGGLSLDHLRTLAAGLR